MSTVCKLLGIKHIRTTPYHPQANGLCEVQHKVLICKQLLEAAAAVAEQQDQRHQSRGSSSSQHQWQQQQTPGAAVATVRGQ